MNLNEEKIPNGNINEAHSFNFWQWKYAPSVIQPDYRPVILT